MMAALIRRSIGSRSVPPVSGSSRTLWMTGLRVLLLGSSTQSIGTAALAMLRAGSCRTGNHQAVPLSGRSGMLGTCRSIEMNNRLLVVSGSAMPDGRNWVSPSLSCLSAAAPLLPLRPTNELAVVGPSFITASTNWRAGAVHAICWGKRHDQSYIDAVRIRDEWQAHHDFLTSLRSDLVVRF